MTRRPTLKEAFCREVVLRDMFFGKFTISISRYVKLISDPKSLVFLTLSWLLLFAADPNGLRITHGPVFALLIWFISVSFYVGVVYGVIGGLAVLQHRLNLPAIYAPLSSTCSLYAVFYCIQIFIGWVTQNPRGPDLWPPFINILITGLTLETLFIRFVLHSIDDGQEPGRAAGLVKIGEREFPIAKISHLNAQEHYVQVTLTNQTLMIRGRIGEAVAQTDASQGFQPHRSWWISRNAKPIMKRQDGKVILILDDRTEVPIAKARIGEVQRWLDLHRTW